MPALLARQYSAKVTQSARRAVTPSVQCSKRPPRSPEIPAYWLRVSTVAAVAKISTGDLRSGPLPAMRLIQAGRDTTGDPLRGVVGGVRWEGSSRRVRALVRPGDSSHGLRKVAPQRNPTRG